MKTGIITLGITLVFAALVTATDRSSSGNNIVKRNALEEGVEGAPPSDAELRNRVAGQDAHNVQDVQDGRYGRNKVRVEGGNNGKPVNDGKGGQGKGGQGKGGLPVTLPGAPALPLDGFPPVGTLTGGLTGVGGLAGGLAGASKLTGGLPATETLPDTNKLVGGLTSAGKLPDTSKLTGGLPIGKGLPLDGVGVDKLTTGGAIGGIVGSSGSSGSPLKKILG